MRNRSLVLFAVAICVAVSHVVSISPLVAQTATTTAKHTTAAKQDIVSQVLKLLQAKLPESVIINKIQTTNTPVNPTTDQLIALKQAGASDTVLSMLENPSGAAPAAAAAPPATAAATPAPAPANAAPPATAVSAAATAQANKKRIAVDEFDYSTVKTTVAAVFGTDQNIGKGIQAMFVKRIAEEGKVVVVERAKINKIMAEQDFAASGRVKQGTGAKIGQIRGADAILYGDIVVFGRDDRKKQVAGGGIIGGAFGAIGAMSKKDKAVVVIDYRLVDAETSEVIATGEARGESVRKSAGLAGLAGAFGAGGGGAQVDMTSSNFAETIVGEATMDCVNHLADELNKQLPNLEQKHVDISARVASVNGPSLIINAGSAQGVAIGDVLQVSHILNEVKDPQTGEVIDLNTQNIGTLEITSVKDRTASGTFHGTTAAKIGDVAEKH